MKKCPYCAEEIEDGTIKCRFCGETLVLDYVVCLLDILGQSKKLKEWGRPLPDGTFSPAAEEAFEHTVGRVMDVRAKFANFFDSFEHSTIPDEVWRTATPAQKETHIRFKACELRTQTFSDTLIFYAPLRNSRGDVSALPLYRMLGGCAMIMLTELARKVAIRGSVTVGLGLELTDNDLYGPVLAEAHRMESECAEHPRVLVSKEAVDFAQQTYGFSDDPRVDTRDATINRFSAGLICKDQEDGRHIVDFLGETMSSFILAMPFANGARTCVIALYQFASEERDEFKRLACKRLEERYSRLLQYIEPRLRYWDVSLDQR